MTFLITGYGASGTKYVADIFKLSGYDVGHEKMGKDGVVSWKHLPEYEKFDPVLHLVRHPLKAIGSSCSGKMSSVRFINKHIPPVISFKKDRVLWAMNAWYHWNRRAEKISLLTFKIENFENTWDRIFQKVGFEAPEKLPQLPRNYNTHSNRKNYRILTWDDLFEKNRPLTEGIMWMALSYGYQE